MKWINELVPRNLIDRILQGALAEVSVLELAEMQKRVVELEGAESVPRK